MKGAAFNSAATDLHGEDSKAAVLVFGAHGWLGTEVVRELALLNHRAVVPDRGFFDQLRGSESEITFTQLVREEHIGAVINCIRPAEDASSAVTYVESSSRLAEMCESNGIFLLHIGSAAEYGAPLTERVSEDHPCRPLTKYATAKAAASSAVINHGGTVIRPFNIAGPRQPLHTVVGDWVSQLRVAQVSDPPITLLVREPDTVRDFVSMNFVASVIANLVDEPPDVPVVNVCSGIPVSFGEFAVSLARHARQRGIEVEVVDGSTPGVRGARSSAIRRVVGDPALLHALGYRSVLDIDNLAGIALR